MTEHLKSLPNPTFTVFAGPMFGGKTSGMLMMLEKFKYQRKKIIVFKPKLDNRYSTDEVVSHSGWSIPARTVEKGDEILESLLSGQEKLNMGDVVAVDEAFMVPGIADVMVWLYKQGFNVVVSTLDISASGKVFKEVEKMLAWATHVVKCPAVCTVCGKDAFFTHKKQLDEDASTQSEILVGGEDIYEPRCFRHFAVIANSLPDVGGLVDDGNNA